jgi:hypothetical protein
MECWGCWRDLDPLCAVHLPSVDGKYLVPEVSFENMEMVRSDTISDSDIYFCFPMRPRCLDGYRKLRDALCGKDRL